MTKELSQIEAEAQVQIAPEAADTLAFVRETEIVDHPGYTVMANYLTTIKALAKKVDEAFDPTIDSIKNSLDTVRASKNRYTKPYKEAEEILKGKLAAYRELKEVEKKERERKLREEAKRLAEEEQKSRAAALAKAGRTEDARALAARPVVAPVIIDSTPIVPKIDGISFRQGFSFRVLDEKMVPREFLMVDESRVRRVVDALGMDARIPGIEIFPDTTVAAGAR